MAKHMAELSERQRKLTELIGIDGARTSCGH
jgi:hypothetical protein